jgi:DMSO/TMAO reductase YedYZ molybdopterin-dependent catalytic subunit
VAPAARRPRQVLLEEPKWLGAVELRATDAPGFWERFGYHNDADPWQEQRHAF